MSSYDKRTTGLPPPAQCSKRKEYDSILNIIFHSDPGNLVEYMCLLSCG